MSFTPGLKVCDNAGMILVGFSMTMNKAMGSSPHQTMVTLTMVTSTMVTSALDHGDFDHGDFDHGDLDHGDLDHGDLNHGDVDHGACTLQTLLSFLRGEIQTVSSS